jgi:hypothetical protein
MGKTTIVGQTALISSPIQLSFGITASVEDGSVVGVSLGPVN